MYRAHVRIPAAHRRSDAPLAYMSAVSCHGRPQLPITSALPAQSCGQLKSLQQENA